VAHANVYFSCSETTIFDTGALELLVYNFGKRLARYTESFGGLRNDQALGLNALAQDEAAGVRGAFHGHAQTSELACAQPGGGLSAAVTA
jgi:hypothetical protein